MDMKNSISRKVRRLVLCIALFALILCTLIGGISMLRMRDQVIKGGRELNENAVKTSELVITKQVKNNIQELAASRASIVNESLSQYKSYIALSASYIEYMYENPQFFTSKEVSAPDKANDGKLVMQFLRRSPRVSLSSVKDEASLLANIEDLWKPIMEYNNGVINSIYLATESGLYLACDRDSGLGERTYWDYSDRGWYLQARVSGKPSYTSTYQDSFGRGLTTSCSSPFYYPDGKFAGVVCMDIFVQDLLNSVINVNLTQNSSAFIVDADGNVIASPGMSKDDTPININTDLRHPAFSASAAILSGYDGVKHTSSGVYFAYSPVPATGWTLVLQIPDSDVNEPVYKIKNSIEDSFAQTESEIKDFAIGSIFMYVSAFAIITVAVVVLSKRFSNRLTKPVTELTHDVRQISGGNLEYRSAVRTDDEIGELANEFNGMAGSLQNYIKELTHITADKERIGAELNIAKQIQASMLPGTFPPFPDHSEFDIYASMVPAKAVGGDFYDFYFVDDTHLALTIADVSGKGIPAALFMMTSRSLLRSSAMSGYSPAEVLKNVNLRLCENNKVGMFVTVWLGILDLTSGKLVCSNAGHEYPVIRRSGGKYELFKDKHGFVLGGMEMSKYIDYEIHLMPGDRLFFHTDGVTEATDAHNELFGSERMLAALNALPPCGCEATISGLSAEINKFVGEAPQFDDITMLAIDINGFLDQK